MQITIQNADTILYKRLIEYNEKRKGIFNIKPIFENDTERLVAFGGGFRNNTQNNLKSKPTKQNKPKLTLFNELY